MTKYNIITLTIMLFAAVFCSCEKINLDDYLREEGEGFSVNFHINGYSITDFEPYGSTSAAKTRAAVDAKKLGTVLNFAVFKDGEKLKTINQKNDSEDFGKISLNLQEGQYEFVILIHSCKGNATISLPEKITFPNNKVTDTFAYYSDIEITENKSFDVTVDRRVSMFRLTIEDAIPDNVADLQFYYTGSSSTLSAITGFGCVNSRQTEYREVASHDKGQVFEIYTFPHDVKDNIDLTVTARDKNENACKEQQFIGIPVEVNKVTKHSCTFFDGSANSGDNADTQFGIKGDNAWDGEILY